MRAIVIEGDQLRWAEVPDVSAGTGEVLIRVAATALNRADLAQRRGSYPPPPGASSILGLECAGEVVAVGAGVKRYRAGDQVCALLAGGGYAEYVNVPAGQVLPIPRGLDTVQAAALPEVFATAWLNLYMEGALQPGETALLHAGASGVGTAAIQLCKSLHNPCFVTAGSAAKIQQLLALGASAGHNRHDGSFKDAVKAWAPAGVDLILDPVGANYLADNLSVLASDGRLVLIGLMGGARAELNLGVLMMKRARLIGSTLRARSVAAKAAVMDQLEQRVWPLLEQGSIRPIIDQVLPMAEVEAAHALMAADANLGKLVLKLG